MHNEYELTNAKIEALTLFFFLFLNLYFYNFDFNLKSFLI